MASCVEHSKEVEILTNLKKEIDKYTDTISTIHLERLKKIYRHNCIKYLNWDFKKYGDFNLEMEVCQKGIYGPTGIIEKNFTTVSFKLWFKSDDFVLSKPEYILFHYKEIFEAKKGFPTIECNVDVSDQGHMLLTENKIAIPVDLTACDDSNYKKLFEMAMGIRNNQMIY